MSLPANTHCPECGNPSFAPHSAQCHYYTPDIYRVDRKIPMQAIVDPQLVDAVLDLNLHPEDKLLQAVRQHSHIMGLPEIEVSAQQGKLLELLVRTAEAQMALEVGTLGGYSTICLARGVGKTGKVISLEYERHHADTANYNIYKAGLADRVDIHVGDAHETLRQLKPHSFDFIFIDADKESNKAYTEHALRLGTDNVTIVVDNVIRDGRVLDENRSDKLEFIEWLGKDSGLDCTVVQTVGSKGWDGFVLAKRPVL